MDSRVKPPQVIEITAKKYEFSPSEIHVRKGTRVELKAHSEDDTHGVKLDVHPEGPKDRSEPGLVFDWPESIAGASRRFWIRARELLLVTCNG